MSSNPRPGALARQANRFPAGWLVAGAAALLSALLYVLAFPPFDVAEAAYVFAVPLLLWLFRPRSPRVAAAAIAGWGLLSWLALIVWLRHVTFAGYLVVATVMALYFSLWFFAAWWTLPRVRDGSFAVRLAGIAGLSALWVVHEYGRSYFLTGFPWLPLAASHWQRPLLLQPAAWTGAYGVSFILIFFNLGLAFYIDRLVRFYTRGWRRICPEFFVALAVVLLGSFGAFRLAQAGAGDRELLFNAAFVQPYIPQTLKWEPEKVEEVAGIVERTTLMTRELPVRPDLVVWPEAVTPLPVVGSARTQAWVEWLAAEMGAPIFGGTVGYVRGDPEEWFNGVVAVDPAKGLLPNHYRKRKLVPFGEYVPFGALLAWMDKFVPLEGSFAHGQSPEPVAVPVAGQERLLGALVCYEDVFPALARQTVRAGAEVLIVVTNNGWYGEEGMPFQHAAHSVLRAVETRRPVLRSGNGGWSGWIDEYGVVREVLRDESGSIYFRGGTAWPIARDAAWAQRQSFYVRHGDWFVGASALLALACLAFCRWRRGAEPPTGSKKPAEEG